ncbi:protein FAR1-RELATED SEQUENCE 5-like [Arachis ipaensis]|uniref:protein FAR1-RELATED SEQUENCE 5-like n=1 Tax=Arachis ipaensis TaxID=130454 RepID=UPI0007AF5445|nr:protein FAR1-RELATED SEQUENCE 5-like [Arachis ipaensis]
MNQSYGSLCAKEEGSDALGPSGDECGDEFQDGGLGVESEAHEYFGDNFYNNWGERAVDGIAELGCINFKELQFVCKMNGFTVRKNKIWRNMKSEVTQQEFVCFWQGFKDMGSVNDGLRWKREPNAETRCGCEAETREVQNHELLEDRLIFMLPGNRKIDATPMEQMNMMLKVRIKMPHIYSSFVHTAEGFQNVLFLKRDMYNQIGKEWRLIGGDVMSCLKFLESTPQENPRMYVSYLADKDGRLVHLFWSDNYSQLDYRLFGYVVAFDVTYRKNKYMYPLVVFSGINHHNQTIMFAAVLVANENDQTYTWLLQ